MAKATPIGGLSASDSFAAAAHKILAVRSGELLQQRDRVLDTGDIEGVHDMRVASRRLRAVLEIFEPCFDKKAHRAALRDVKRLADDLGRRRDPDVQIALLESFASEASIADREGIESLIESLRAEQAEANDLLREALNRVDDHGLQSTLAELTQDSRP
ncbi:MAG: CHAD domain-containing protein [Solirubrobacterales bacterium]